MKMLESILDGFSRANSVQYWRELAEDRGRWRSIVVKAGQKRGAIGPHPDEGKRRRRRRNKINAKQATQHVRQRL